jgi:putative colanic acid biosynthesis acetyltransferase WcaF
LLLLFGASLEADVRIRRTVRIECPWNLSIGRDSAVGDHTILYCLGPVRIGNRVAISQGAHICAGTHDYRFRSMPLVRASITILDDAWICADAFVGPGVVVHEGTILGARAVAMRSLEPWSIYLGNPAVLAKQRPRFSE